MRFQTVGHLRRVDLGPIIDLLPALRDEWANLRFGRDGRLINPLTDDTVDVLALVDGRHRQGGATYRITVTSPELELPEERRAEFEKEARGGTQQEHVTASLREDSARKLSFALSNDDEHWTVDLNVEHGRLPKVELAGRVDVTASLRVDGTPGWLAALLGGTGHGSAMLDFGTLERGGRAIEAGGAANRFRGRARIDVQTSVTRWTVVGDGTLRARGLGRLVLLFAGSRIRRSIERSFAAFWASSESHASELEKEISWLQRAIDEEGGPAPFVRRALWDDDFDRGLGAVRSGRDRP